MTPQDLELFQTLTRRQATLEEAVIQLRADLTYWERQALSVPSHPESLTALPPLPALITAPTPITPPPLSEITGTIPILQETLPEAPTAEVPLPPIPPIQIPAPTQRSDGEPTPGLEFQFGRWLARIGVAFALITLISFSTLAYKHFHHLMGPWSRLVVLTATSIGLITAGLKIERISRLTVYGRTLAGGGLACLYYTLYGATYVTPLQVIHNQLLGGFLLLVWSAYVLYLAEKKKSELLSVFAIALAYFSSAITPVGDFTMVANLILSLTAVVFLIRNAWAGLSYLCLVGTYLGLLRQFVVYDGTSDYWFDLAHNISFSTSSVYLAGAWIIYTAGIFLCTTPQFAAGKRMAFLCLNNGALIGLLTLAAHLSGFGHIGSILCLLGGIFLATSYLAKSVRADADDIAGAYLMQGLALATGGIAIVYTGVTRGLLITVESVFLCASGAFSRNIIFRIAGYVSALLGTGYLFGEIVFNNHSSWILPLGGTAAMLANAWLARREFWKETREVASTWFVYSSAYYILLALGLLTTGIFCLQTSDAWSTVDLAFAALVLTLSIYLIPLFELPLLSQALLMLAQITAFLPLDTGSPAPGNQGTLAQPQWSQNLVALITMILVTWWPRQKSVPIGAWIPPLLLTYALAMVCFGFNAIHPQVDAQGWMIAASFLSLVFLAYGVWARTWQFMASGQIFLALATWTFFNPPVGPDPFPWAWWAAAIPPAVIFLTGWLVHQRLSQALQLSENARNNLVAAAYLYQVIALGLVVRWIFGIVPIGDQTFAFLLLSTGLLLWNVRWPSAFGLRAAMIVSLIGAFSYRTLENDYLWTDSAAFLLFLMQPAILRHWGRDLVTELESWLLILVSCGMGWYFVSSSIDQAGSNNLTLGWAIFALAVTVIGFIANERRQRWCGLAILVASIIRVGLYDFWGFSDLYKVLTFFALTVICLGLSFIYYKFGDRLKELL
jgi:hypothetical protein